MLCLVPHREVCLPPLRTMVPGHLAYVPLVQPKWSVKVLYIIIMS
jgi:hypothetical protein